MDIEGVVRIWVGAAAVCGMLAIAGCNAGLSSHNSSVSSSGTPIPSVKAPGDWGRWMLAGGTAGVGMFPAKFTWDVNAAPSCANDFVAFNTSLAGAADTTAASQTGSFLLAALPGQTVTITSPNGTSLVLTADALLNTGLDFLVSALPALQATNLRDAINRNGAGVGVTASSAGGVVTVTAAATGGDGNLITLATNMGALQFTWAGSNLTGGVGTANIVAFNQLYASQSGGLPAGLCGSSGPSVYWSYFTGTGTTVTSVVLSGDGAKVAFVENVSGTATLRILKWKAGEGTAPGKPVAPTTTLAPGQNWTTNCPAANSCLSSIAFSGAAAIDTKSSPFYVYTNNADILYVGDNSGRVHKFTGVFSGTPAEAGAPWPITVNATPGTILTSPIYDGGSGNIFVGDSTGRLSFIRETGSTAGTCTPQPCLDATNIHIGGAGGSIDDAPIVDGAAGTVMAINSNDGTNNGSILQASTALVASAGSPWKIGGNAGAGSAIYSGAFDNTYFSTPASGHMYVCGKSPNNGDRPAVYQLGFNGSGVLTSVSANPFGNAPPFSNTLTTASGAACSPVTEFYNPNGGGTGVARDWIFFSVATTATSTNPPLPSTACSTVGCVISVHVTGGPAWPPATATHNVPVPGNATGSTSGFVVDNQADISISAQASSFYFTLGTNSTGAGPGVPSCNTTAGTGCVIKLTQGLLN
jgi:hypothetical protein